MWATAIKHEAIKTRCTLNIYLLSFHQFQCLGSFHLNVFFLRNSPHHVNANVQSKGTADLVELQSFYHLHQSSSQPSSGFFFHHQLPPDPSATLKVTRAQASTGNYALPYDVLPTTNRGDNMTIYGSRVEQLASGQNSQSQSMSEPLYATANKPPPIMTSFNPYCPKVSIVRMCVVLY